ncbi:MAG: DUF4179 domain-containing protein [Clostridium sp.]
MNNKMNIYEMINDAELNETDYDFEPLNDIEKIRIKKNIKNSICGNKHRYRRVAAAIMISVIGIGALGIGTGAGAEVMMQVRENIESALNIEKNIDDYKTVINKSVTDNNITIQLNEVILNEKELIISTNISSDRILGDDEFYDEDKTIYINNKKVKFTGQSGSAGKIDDKTTQSVLMYDLDTVDEKDLEGDLDIKIVYSKVSINNRKPVRGKWVFEFKANKDMLMADTNEIKLDYSFSLDNGEKVTLEKYKSNDIGQNIYAEVEGFNKNESYDIQLRGTDDLNNEVIFYISRGRKDYLDFKYDNFNKNIDDNAKTITLTPYAVKMPEQSGKMPDADEYVKVGEEFTIDLSKIE